MELTDLQHQARTYADYEFGLGPYYSILGLSEEVGKLNEKLRVILKNNQGSFSSEDIVKLEISIGDTLFWLLNMISDLGVSIDETVALMLKKQILMKEKRDKKTLTTNINDNNTQITQANQTLK